MFGDSTNATREGESGSEAEVRKSLIDLVGQERERVVITCFASNVARLESAAIAAETHGRSCGLVGRSLWRMEQVARATGFLGSLPPFVREDEAMDLPRDKVLLVSTGSQGEPRAALTRIAGENHPQVSLDPGDTVIFSSRIIPGNERPIGRLQNQLARRGIKVLTESDHFVHVSGHPARAELRRMYELVRPKLAVPVHGERRHLTAHAELAAECGVKQTLVVENGDMVRVAPGPAGVIDHVDTGRLGLDGKNLVALESGAFRTRLRMSSGGAAVATIVLDRRGRLVTRPQVTVHGLLGEDVAEVMTGVEEAVTRAINDLPADQRDDDEAAREAGRLAVRRSLWASHGKRPVTDVHVVRI